MLRLQTQHIKRHKIRRHTRSSSPSRSTNMSSAQVHRLNELRAVAMTSQNLHKQNSLLISKLAEEYKKISIDNSQEVAPYSHIENVLPESGDSANSRFRAPGIEVLQSKKLDKLWCARLDMCENLARNLKYRLPRSENLLYSGEVIKVTKDATRIKDTTYPGDRLVIWSILKIIMLGNSSEDTLTDRFTSLHAILEAIQKAHELNNKSICVLINELANVENHDDSKKSQLSQQIQQIQQIQIPEIIVDEHLILCEKLALDLQSTLPKIKETSSDSPRVNPESFSITNYMERIISAPFSLLQYIWEGIQSLWGSEIDTDYLGFLNIFLYIWRCMLIVTLCISLCALHIYFHN